jgi:hypothetical protein
MENLLVQFHCLNNSNYDKWQLKAQHLLIKEKSWKYVSPGTAPNPVTDAWTEGDAKAMSTICLLIDDKQRKIKIVKDAKTVKATWDALKLYHHKATLTSKVSLLKELCNKNFQDGDNMEDTYKLEQFAMKEIRDF